MDKKNTTQLQITNFKTARYIPDVIDEKSKGYMGSIDGMLYHSASLLKQIAYAEDMPKVVIRAVADGYIHSFAEKYDVQGEIEKYEAKDMEERETYEANFKKGFEAGILTHGSVDMLMRKGLGIQNYQPLIFTKDEL
jgi:c-di-GMP-related signal transduction protein